MIKHFLILASLLISSYTYSYGVPSTSHDIEERDGIVYEVKSGEPFTGVWKFFRDEKLVLREEYKDGKKHGLFETYDELKRLKLREHFKDGKKHGLFERFDCHGSGRNPKCQLADRVNYKDGKLHGLSEFFFAYWGNGQICQRTEFKEGERNGIHEVFNEKGELVEKGITTDDGEFIRANVPLAEIIDHILCQALDMKKLLTILCLVLLSSYSYSQDLPPDGPYEDYHENGQLKEKGNQTVSMSITMRTVHFERKCTSKTKNYTVSMKVITKTDN